MDLDLWRVVIETTSEAADTIETLLLDRGALGTEIVDVADILRQEKRGTGEWVDPSILKIPSQGAQVSAYTPMLPGEDKPAQDWWQQVQDVLAAVRDSGLATGTLAISYEAVPASSYEDAWKAHYHALAISERIVVVPLWERAAIEVEPGRTPVYMDPGMAFGTGTHETTTLCLRLIDERIQPGISRVLDLGTGSGILAIAAAKLGAASVFAVDLDEQAVAVAQQNAQANDLADWLADGRLQFAASDLLAAVPETLRFTMILANLLAAIVVRAAPFVKAALAPGGCLIASGLVTHQADEVQAELAAAGFSKTSRRQLGDWVALVAFVD